VLAERVYSVRDEEVLLRNVSLMRLEWSSSEAKYPKGELGVPLWQTLKIKIDEANGAGEQK